MRPSPADRRPVDIPREGRRRSGSETSLGMSFAGGTGGDKEIVLGPRGGATGLSGF